jgi:alpha-tubulin suppressor-like RCC1 family protein
MACWGLNDVGRLGDGTFQDRSAPTAVIGLDGPVVSACAGNGHTCAVLENGEARCWGLDHRGQLGRGPVVMDAVGLPVPSPVTIDETGTPLGGLRSIACGATHTCALDSAGVVYCWGENHVGQLGIGMSDVAAHFTPERVGTIEAVSLDAGGAFTCAVTTASELHCWGDNAFGQITLTPDSIGHPSPERLTIAGKPAPVPLSVDVGTFGGCVVLSGGGVACWGSNYWGVTGRPMGPSPWEGPARHPTVPGAIGVSVGNESACAWDDMDEVRCWGANHHGQLGVAPDDDAHPVPVASIFGSEQAAVGGDFTCAIARGRVHCWGIDRHRTLGRGNVAFRSTPYTIAASTGATHATTGLAHTCWVAGGQTSCCGLNVFDQLGIDDRPRDRSVAEAIGPMDAVSVWSGFGHGCLVTAMSTLFCWGWNASGQAAFPPAMSQLLGTPTGALGVPELVQIAGGMHHTCALDAGGNVLCWGSDSHGQAALGMGPSASTSAPTMIGLARATSIAAGFRHTCAVVAGSSYCWGDGRAGQLGREIDRATEPSMVDLPATPTGVAAGEAHSCVRLDDSRVLCWGEGEHGRLGDGSQAPGPRTAVEVVGLADATSVAAGGRHTCAIRAGGELVCWGANRAGQLGNGTTLDSAEPVRVVLPTRATGVWAGYEHTCALAGDRLHCWGAGWAGKLCDEEITLDALSQPIAGSAP